MDQITQYSVLCIGAKLDLVQFPEVLDFIVCDKDLVEYLNLPCPDTIIISRLQPLLFFFGFVWFVCIVSELLSCSTSLLVVLFFLRNLLAWRDAAVVD